MFLRSWLRAFCLTDIGFDFSGIVFAYEQINGHGLFVDVRSNFTGLRPGNDDGLNDFGFKFNLPEALRSPVKEFDID